MFNRGKEGGGGVIAQGDVHKKDLFCGQIAFQLNSDGISRGAASLSSRTRHLELTSFTFADVVSAGEFPGSPLHKY